MGPCGALLVVGGLSPTLPSPTRLRFPPKWLRAGGWPVPQGRACSAPGGQLGGSAGGAERGDTPHQRTPSSGPCTQAWCPGPVPTRGWDLGEGLQGASLGAQSGSNRTPRSQAGAGQPLFEVVRLCFPVVPAVPAAPGLCATTALLSVELTACPLSMELTPCPCPQPTSPATTGDSTLVSSIYSLFVPLPTLLHANGLLQPFRVPKPGALKPKSTCPDE